MGNTTFYNEALAPAMMGFKVNASLRPCSPRSFVSAVSKKHRRKQALVQCFSAGFHQSYAAWIRLRRQAGGP